MSRKRAHSSQHPAGRQHGTSASRGAEGAASHGTAWRIGALVGIALLGLVAWYLISAREPGAGEPPVAGAGADVVAAYVGSPSCAQCHAAESQAWQASQHAVAMQHATASTVLGDFNDASYDFQGVESRFFQREGKYYIQTDGPDGTLADFEVRFTFGIAPLQQYLVQLPGGRLQAVALTWDARPREEGGQRWFRQYPTEPLDHTDELHWTRRSQNWNFMCAECHSTGLRKNYDAKADRFVRPLAEAVEAEIIAPLDVTSEGEMDAVFEMIREKWGRLDFVLHAIAYAPMDDLHGRVTDCSRDGFLQAMDISCHSLIRLAKLAEPLMQQGGAIQTVSYLGSEKVVDNYNVMGPVKSALESVVRYLAAELGPKGIRVNTLSPGPLMTRAASGIGHFSDLVSKVIDRAPTHQLTTIEEVGAMSAFLMTDLAGSVNGELIHLDGGYNVMA